MSDDNANMVNRVETKHEGVSYATTVKEEQENQIAKKKTVKEANYKAQGDLIVTVKAKDLCAYILDVTQKCPKQHRVTFAIRLQNHALDVVTEIYLANDIYIKSLGRQNEYARYIKRLDYQRGAIAKLRLIGYISLLAVERNVLTAKQYRIISEKSTEVIIMLASWITADKNRLVSKD